MHKTWQNLRFMQNCSINLGTFNRPNFHPWGNIPYVWGLSVDKFHLIRASYTNAKMLKENLSAGNVLQMEMLKSSNCKVN